MSPETPHRVRAGAAIVAAALTAQLGLLAALPATARADAADDLQAVQQQIQEGNQAYEDATARVEELEGQISANQERVGQIEQLLPERQERAESSLRALYKMQQGSSSLIELLLSADDFFDLVTTIQYLDAVQSHNLDAVSELTALADELAQTQVALEQQRSEAKSEQQRAADALAEANAARSSLEAQIAAQAAAEEAERQAAIEAAQAAAEQAAAAEQEPTFTTESGSEAVVEVPSSPDPGTVDWDSEKDAFVTEWSGRIDAYLAGSPLAGQGSTFAEAAWEYGVDPRFSPAIAMVESSLGRACFLPHNAWGWGSSSWDSWEDAIWDHVAGLASGYGGQLTYAGAKKYCPPNADHWYTSVLANMEKI